MDPSGFTVKNLRGVEDAAAKHGFGETGEARFARDDLDARDTGISLHTLRAGKRQAFGHRHTDAEEIYVVLQGSGLMALDDQIVEVRAMDAIRIAPTTTRALEAGPDGMEVLAVGPHHPGDSEIAPGWWAG